MPTVIVPDITVTLTHITCCSCGINFAVDARWIKRRKDDHVLWYCPNGHRQHWDGPSKAEQEAERLRAALSSAEMRASSWKDQAQAEARQHSATKGQLTKTRKRAASALCPVCSRSFKQVRQHLTRMHPDFVNPGAVEKHTHP